MLHKAAAHLGEVLVLVDLLAVQDCYLPPEQCDKLIFLKKKIKLV